MDRKTEVLEKLKESREFVSGQELCEALQVSRTSIWKIVAKLRDEGYPIESVSGKGYRLGSMEDRDLLNGEQLESAMKTKWVGHPLLFSRETGSTNDDIFRLSEEGYPQGTLAVTAMQTAGKGRRGRVWISPPDVNVYMSILLKPDLPADRAHMVTLVMALAIYQAALELQAAPGVKCEFGIKWPNDIVASRDGGPYKKLCGILTEMRMEETEIRDIVIGTGLNVNQKKFPPQIEETASSFSLQLGREVNRARFTGRIWEYFERDCEQFLQAGTLAPLRDAYEQGLVNRGRAVRVLDPKAPFSGTAKGITDTGELIVAPDDGSADRQVGTGEISVRGVMGYV